MANIPLITYLGYDPEFPNAKRYEVVAIHVGVSGNNKLYSSDELYKAGRSLSFRPTNIDHFGYESIGAKKTKYQKSLSFPENATVRAEYDPEAVGVRTVVRVSDPETNRLIETGVIVGVSVESEALENCNLSGICEKQNLIFKGLSWITNVNNPLGDPNAKIISSVETAIPNDTFKDIPMSNILMADANSNTSNVNPVTATATTDASKETPKPSVESVNVPTVSVPQVPEPQPIPTATETPKVIEIPTPATSTEVKVEQPKTDVKASPTETPSKVVEQVKDLPKENLKNPEAVNKSMAESKPDIPSINDAESKVTTSIESKADKQKAYYDKVAENLRESIESIASTANSSLHIGKVWKPDMFNLPAGLTANLRELCEVQEVPQGNDTVYFTTISTPEFTSIDGDNATEESDATHTLARISLTCNLKGAKQTITFKAVQLITGDIVREVEEGWQESAILSEDDEILTALDAVADGSLAGAIFGDGSVANEASVTSSMKFTEDLLLDAKTKIRQAKHKATNLVAIMNSKPLGDLTKRSSVKDAGQSGDGGRFAREGVIDRIYGVDIYNSDKGDVGTGAGASSIDVYRSYVLKRGCLGLGIARNLTFETIKTTKMADVIRAYHMVGATVKIPKQVVRIYTA